MSEKTDIKKKLIIQKASEVFASKGYRAVTMKDIVEACQISRGGLYLYYSSTEELFIDVLAANEAQDSDKSIDGLQDADASALLLLFIKEQKQDILRKKNSLLCARYEYAFMAKENGDTKAAKNAFETSVAVLDNILNRGNDSGEFSCSDTASTARNMMYAIEGMRMCAASFGISEKRVDSELMFLMKQFMETK